MKHFSFNPFGNESIVVKFECDNCNQDIESDEIYIPTPDYSADRESDSQVEEEVYVLCPNCEKEFDITIYVTYAGGDGSIKNLPEDYPVDVIENPEPYYEDQYEAISSNTFFFDTFKNEIENLKELNKIKLENTSIDKTLRRQIFTGAIASMETYLSDAFINTTLNSKKLTEKFVETFHEFREKTITLNELFDYHDKIEAICKQAMLDIIYHNLPKVKGMYKDTLGVDLGNIGKVYKAVLTRHDVIHRNGKTKEGKEVNIDISSAKQLINDIEDFIEKIDEQIKHIEDSNRLENLDMLV
jgi:hypothetical protein